MDVRRAHICIHCGYPTVSLYRIQSGGHIKLVECSHCRQDVDPYIEREMLLVIIDWVLLRRPAYRHLIFNRPIQEYFMPSLLCIIISNSFLRLSRDTEHNLSRTLHASELAFACFWVIFKWTLLTLGSVIVVNLCIIPNFRSLKHPLRIDMLRSISIAILTPCLFSVVTAFIYIYEPSSTIRILGTIYTFISQVLAADTVFGCYRIYLTQSREVS